MDYHNIIIELGSDELKEYLDAQRDEYLLVDVREPKEYKKAHIPGAMLVRLKEVEGSMAQFDQDKDVIFYCRSGRRSRIAASFVAEMGLSVNSIYNLKGGMLGWQGKTL